MVLFQNNNNNNNTAKKISNSQESCFDMMNNDIMQLGMTVQNNQLELMQMLHLLHGMQNKIMKDMVDFTTRFENVEESLLVIKNDDIKELRELLLSQVSCRCYLLLIAYSPPAIIHNLDMLM